MLKFYKLSKITEYIARSPRTHSISLVRSVQALPHALSHSSANHTPPRLVLQLNLHHHLQNQKLSLILRRPEMMSTKQETGVCSCTPPLWYAPLPISLFRHLLNCAIDYFWCWCNLRCCTTIPYVLCGHWFCWHPQGRHGQVRGRTSRPRRRRQTHQGPFQCGYV